MSKQCALDLFFFISLFYSLYTDRKRFKKQQGDPFGYTGIFDKETKQSTDIHLHTYIQHSKRDYIHL